MSSCLPALVLRKLKEKANRQSAGLVVGKCMRGKNVAHECFQLCWKAMLLTAAMQAGAGDAERTEVMQKEQIGLATLYLADCRDALPEISGVNCVASYGRPTDLFYLELSAPKGKTA